MLWALQCPTDHCRSCSGDPGLDGCPDLALVLAHGLSIKDLCDQVATGPSSPPGNSTAPPPPAACGKLPSLGPVVTGGTHTTNDGITTLSCIYSQGPKSFPLGWIIIMTFRSRAAAAKFFNDNIAGTPAPGFTEPVRYGKDCRSATPTATVCARYEFALHGYRIDELTQQSNPPATRRTADARADQRPDAQAARRHLASLRAARRTSQCTETSS